MLLLVLPLARTILQLPSDRRNFLESDEFLLYILEKNWSRDFILYEILLLTDLKIVRTGPKAEYQTIMNHVTKICSKIHYWSGSRIQVTCSLILKRNPAESKAKRHFYVSRDLSLLYSIGYILELELDQIFYHRALRQTAVSPVSERFIQKSKGMLFKHENVMSIDRSFKFSRNVLAIS